jgi:MoxR-like ATPase
VNTWTLYKNSEPSTAADSNPIENCTDEEARSAWLSDPPPWRAPGQSWEARKEIDGALLAVPAWPAHTEKRARSYVSTGGATEQERVNIALLLRRPLLVRGPPGVGKSSLAGRIAWALGLGPPLRWEINSRTTLSDGLYRYDAVGHMRDAGPRTVADFITLGPLGTALLPTELPRVLLIDELDKSSYDLANDLLHVFEEGTFVLPELARDTPEAEVATWDNPKARARILEGRVRTHHHPVVVITSNDEREFPAAFLRRVVELELKQPDDHATLRGLLAGWMGSTDGIDDVLNRFPKDERTDVLLQALYLSARHKAPLDELVAGLSRDNKERDGG